MGQKVFIGTEENMDDAPPEWMWFKPVAGGLEIRVLDQGSWVLKATISLTNHAHPTHGDIDFTGSVSSGGEAGINTPGEGEYEVGQIESIKVRNGLIVGFTEK